MFYQQLEDICVMKLKNGQLRIESNDKDTVIWEQS
jgi:hypothetical protein